MSAFVIKKVNTGIMFNLKADNGQVIAASEGYKAKESCENGIASVRENAPVAEIVEELAPTATARTCRVRAFPAEAAFLSRQKTTPFLRFGGKAFCRWTAATVIPLTFHIYCITENICCQGGIFGNFPQVARSFASRRAGALSRSVHRPAALCARCGADVK